jgi:hypothetical protein
VAQRRPGEEPGPGASPEVGAASGLAIPAGDNGEGSTAWAWRSATSTVTAGPTSPSPTSARTSCCSTIARRHLQSTSRRGDGRCAGACSRGRSRSITWAVHLFDHDNDADLDLYFAGGKIHDDELIPDALLRNEGAGYPEGAYFTEVTWAAGLTTSARARARRWSTSTATVASTSPPRTGPTACASITTSARARSNHWLVVDLVGTSSEPRGARQRRRASRRRRRPAQTCFRTPNPSLGAGGELDCHFGLGDGDGDHGAERDLAEWTGAGGGDDGGRPARARGAGRVAVPTAVPEAWDGGPACGASRGEELHEQGGDVVRAAAGVGVADRARGGLADVELEQVG